ncbi:hypothetical protein OIU85_006840 [Salix viminalis]|uniref:RING-type domain-containing protein n=1 Tax=Salix viminalis TaxID=40686 RepID=A0A9Q0PMP8_SALVM|nr:hypothetical protein OIU85_006840 [Salix viminalis]
MNSSTDYNRTVHVSSAYDTGLALGVLILILIVALVAYSCSGCVREPSTYPITNHGSSVADRGSVVIDIGLNEATLASYSKVLYSQAKLQHEGNDSQPFCCSICLGDYEDNDMLRFLPGLRPCFSSQMCGLLVEAAFYMSGVPEFAGAHSSP